MVPMIIVSMVVYDASLGLREYLVVPLIYDLSEDVGYGIEKG